MQLWFRSALVASGVWLAGVTICSAVMRDFAWTSYRTDFGPAMVTAIVGVLAIFVICLGVPWAQRRRDQKPQ